MRLLSVLLTVTLCCQVFAERPNIIYILADDLGWGDLSCFGQTNWSTPNIDRMSAEGMRFTQAYAGSTVCAPSRAALLTGQHAGRGFMRGNGRISLRPDPSDITIATRLRDLGYATAMIGKSGVACLSTDPTLPNTKGFDHFFGLIDHAAAHRNYPPRMVRNGQWIEYEGNRGKTGTTYANELFVEESIEWIERHADRPFFLHIALTTPHADLTVPERYMAPFRGRFPESPHTTSGYFHQPEPRAAFAGMIMFLDESVGRILETVRRQGISENTVVIFASDNGPHYEGGADAEVFDSNGPWRGGKRALYEGGIRIPQIVWWPGHISAGSESDHLTAFWDFPATALELAGGKGMPADTQGISIVPTLLGNAEQDSHRYLYWEFYEQGGKQAVRSENWKAIRRGTHQRPDGPLELYNLQNDPGETTDVAAEHPRVVKLMTRYMDHAHQPSPEFSFGQPERSISRPKENRRLSNENDRFVLDRSAFEIHAFSSESAFNSMRAANVLDADIDSRWHTEWRDARPGHPHSITVDLGQNTSVRGIRLMARQDGTDHGTLKDVEVFVTETAAPDPSEAQRATLRFTKDEQEILFRNPIRGRFITIRSVTAWGDSPFASLSNLEVLGD